MWGQEAELEGCVHRPRNTKGGQQHQGLEAVGGPSPRAFRGSEVLATPQSQTPTPGTVFEAPQPIQLHRGLLLGEPQDVNTPSSALHLKPPEPTEAQMSSLRRQDGSFSAASL